MLFALALFFLFTMAFAVGAIGHQYPAFTESRCLISIGGASIEFHHSGSSAGVSLVV
jgi:hypothetical protein